MWMFISKRSILLQQAILEARFRIPNSFFVDFSWSWMYFALRRQLVLCVKHEDVSWNLWSTSACSAVCPFPWLDIRVVSFALSCCASAKQATQRARKRSMPQHEICSSTLTFVLSTGGYNILEQKIHCEEHGLMSLWYCNTCSIHT